MRRLSTAVAVDGAVTPALRTQIQNIVAAAIGFDPARGDQINVESLPFDNSMQQQMAAEMEAQQQRQQQLRRYLMWGGAGLGGLLLLLLLLIVILRRRRRAAVPAILPERMLGEKPKAGMEAAAPVAPLMVEPVEPVDVEKVRQEAERKAKMDRLRDIIRQRPEDAALLIRAWLSED